MSAWSTVAESSLPAAALALNTYAPNATTCVKGHRFLSEADCVLPEEWDYFLCRRCVEGGEPDERPYEYVLDNDDLDPGEG